MPRHRRNNNKSDVLVDAEFRIKVEKVIQDFSSSNDTKYTFPALLTNVERAFVHQLCPKFHLKSKSDGYGDKRRLSLFKLVEDENFVHQSAKFSITFDSRELFQRYLKTFPNLKSHDGIITRKAEIVNNFQPFALTSPPKVPPEVKPTNNSIYNVRKNLSIYNYKDQIIQAIDSNRILLVQGSTGCGKTTQIPQYIMETAYNRKEPCRIICTQPRRISAIASAERVCYENGTSLGTTVGYQIRLDSKISTGSNCIFLTPGVFLRYLMGRMPEKLFKKITHIIIDEAHERNKENDFLLTSIKEHFNVNPNLKLLIMSATMDTSVFKNYFGSSEEISIATKQFHVEEFYLEDVLKLTNFTNRRVEELNEKYRSGQLIQSTKSAYIIDAGNENVTFDIDDEFKDYLDDLLEKMSTHDQPESHFDEFLYYVMNDGTPINYRHRQTKMTALMIAIGREWTDMVEKLLQMKADPNLKVDFGGYEISSYELADKLHGSDSKVKQLLVNFKDHSKNLSNDECYNKALLNIYQDTVLKTKNNSFITEETIDHELIVRLVQKIHTETDKKGAILIFLPGFDDIIQLSKLINDTIRFDYNMFLLHSSMRTTDQKNVFKPSAYGKRKIILSTNIAESSVTIDDVEYVIDSGREKQKSYDSLSHSSALRVQWISKASANQRRGRAGRLRDGIVYRIYSRDRFKSMLEVTIPELLRTSLTEICLQTKLLIDEHSKIEDFLLRCIACPSLANIRQSIKYLQKMGALDSNENLTLLGSHLVSMPLEAKYGKILIYSIIFKCLDPILSLVSILTMGDQVFTLPVNPFDRALCEQWRKSVAGAAFSDHFLMLKIFTHWMNLKQNNQNDKKFCDENFISRYHIEHVRGIRNQILSHLQSSGLVKENINALNDNSNNWSVIKAVIAAGLYPFVARIERQKGMMYTEIDHRLNFHMSSVMCMKKEPYKHTIRQLPVDWCVFEEKNRIGRTPMLKCNTLLGNLAMCFVTGFELKEESKALVPPDDGDDEWEDEDSSSEDDDECSDFLNIKVDNFVKFFTTKNDSSLLLTLRQHINGLLVRFLSEKNFHHSRDEEFLVDCIAKALDAEDLASGLPRISIMSSIQVPSASQQQMNNQRGRNTSGTLMRNNQISKYFISNYQQPQKQQPFINNDHRTHHSSNPLDEAHSRDTHVTNQSQNQYTKRPRSSRQPPSGYGEQKFYIVKCNKQKFFTSLVENSVVDLKQLNLKIWLFHKIQSQVKKNNHIHIIFYSTKTNSFLGYGEISKIDDSHPLQFYLRFVKTLPLNSLGSTKFAQDIAHPLTHQSFNFHELDQSSGNSLILYFQS